jgi:hypothetical protein
MIAPIIDRRNKKAPESPYKRSLHRVKMEPSNNDRQSLFTLTKRRVAIIIFLLCSVASIFSTDNIMMYGDRTLSRGGGEDPSLRTTYVRKNTSNTTMLPSDLIYSRDWWEKPTVIEEYKLIFFTIPKVACTEWKFLFRKMSGLSYYSKEGENVSLYQNPKTNGLMTLDKYPLSEAERMMNSPDWTKAIFLREPKERIVSAFLNKFTKDKDYFRQKCCREDKLPNAKDRRHCDNMMDIRNFTYFLDRTLDCKDPHWAPQFPVVDEKWWGSMNFIGSMESVSSDAKKLLESLSSVSDGKNVTAWEKHGKQGWGFNRTGGFMQRNNAGHSAHASKRLCEYLTDKHEAFLEEHWHVEWEHQEYMQYEKKRLCNATQMATKRR